MQITRYAPEDMSLEAIQAVLLDGDIQKLPAAQRIHYYRMMCDSLGLNWLTRPFDFIKDDTGKLRPYARKEAAEQLRAQHKVSLKVLRREWLDADLYAVTVHASTPDGREDESQGIANIPQEYTGKKKGIAMMRAETAAKRRATLSLLGLGWALSPEVETHDRVQGTHFNPVTGELPEEGGVEVVPHPREEIPLSPQPPVDAATRRLRKLWAVVNEYKIPLDTFRAHLEETYHTTSTKALTAEQVDEICQAVDAGLLAAAREPGKDDA